MTNIYIYNLVCVYIYNYVYIYIIIYIYTYDSNLIQRTCFFFGCQRADISAQVVCNTLCLCGSVILLRITWGHSKISHEPSSLTCDIIRQFTHEPSNLNVWYHLVMNLQISTSNIIQSWTFKSQRLISSQIPASHACKAMAALAATTSAKSQG